MILNDENYLEHYGILRKSGRYPWGSGASQTARNRDFLDTVANLRSKGLTDAKIAEGFGITRNQLTAARSIALNQQKQERVLQAQRLKDKGWSNVKIGQRMGLNESSVRALLAPGEKDKIDVLQATAKMLKDHVDKKNYVDIGAGVENQIGISRNKLQTAVALLQEQGYTVHTVKIPQVTGSGQLTTLKVLAKPGVAQKEVWTNRAQIKQITDHTKDGGRSYLGIKPPINISSKRIGINYAEQGGGHADGVIYVRPGVKDVSIGGAHYAQVRISVDGTHYLKGMAVYKEDLPAGVDLVFNTNKSNTGNKLDAFKAVKDDPENPFGATIRQITGHDGKVTSAMNIVGSPAKEGSGQEGAWDKWSRNLPSQMLSKQHPSLAKQQLDMTYEAHVNEFNTISRLTNPTVRRSLLESFSDETDSSAVHLRAAALPSQATKVLLPVPTLKEHEIYAPTFRNGERVALIRFPHGGTFEIPQLTVNNRHADSRKLLGNVADAVGINHAVAQRLSGADFDGDTVLVIPNSRGVIKSTPPLEGLKGFDPKHSYPPYHGMRTVDGGTWNEKTKAVDYGGRPPKTANMQQEMGKISNLITDMTIRGAKPEEIAQAVRHSMVVIDSEKHSLDYRSSSRDNGIASLKEKYQGGSKAGAKTLISRARAKVPVVEKRPRSAAKGGPIDPATGRKIYEPTGRMVPDRKKVTDPATGRVHYVDTGKTKPKMQESRRLAETDDAHTLSSGTPIERIYADHSNRLKALANEARKTMLATKSIPYSPSAKKTYANEVASLEAKLNVAEKNAPRERQAQVIAGAVVSQKRQANPHIDAADLKKIRNQALIEARTRTGAGKDRIVPTQSEFNAIQAGAISNHKLEQILRHADLDAIKKLATPKTEIKMTTIKLARAKAMLATGYTQREVADQLGVSLSTLKASIDSHDQ